MTARIEAVDAVKAPAALFDFEATFRGQYARIARVISCIVRDPARAEELAVEVFLKLWHSPSAQGNATGAWLYKVAVRKALDELRRQARRARYEKLLPFARAAANPEQLHACSQEQQRVRAVLAALPRRQAELLLLRSNDLTYEEIAQALSLNAASVGTLLSRAQQAFRKEYLHRHGQK